MVEDRGLGRARGAGVVVRADRVQELGADSGLERRGALLDQAQAQMDVAEQAALLGRFEDRPARQLDRPADVVEERRGEEQVGAQPGMELRHLAADRRDADRVLEEPARVAVMAVDGRGQRAQPTPQLVVADEASDGRLQAGVRDLAREELEKALELVSVAAQGGRERLRIEILDRLERADLELQPVAKAVDPSEHAHRVALVEPGVEQVDVAPDARLDPSAGVDELEGEVRSAPARAQPLLLRDRVDALDDAVLLELGDRRHVPSLGPKTDGTVRAKWPR